MFKVDPDSPVPLYHQIAEAIRARIEAGELAPGDALEPLRQAAESWNVNLHTVRHAYAALARSGLVASHRGPLGTRVVGTLPRPAGKGDRDLDALARRVAQEAARRFGATPDQLAAALTRLGRDEGAPSRPEVWVVECSEWQCRSHAEEIARRFEVEALPWPLTSGAEPPPGTALSTYFHYNDIRLLWPTRFGGLHFLTIHPDRGLPERLQGTERILVAERDRSTAEAVRADLVALFAGREMTIEPFVDDEPASCLERTAGVPVLFPPRVWAVLPEERRADPRAIELRYHFDPGELDELARELGWLRSRELVA